SVESEWVEREYLLSNNLKKKTLPIMYRDCELPLGFLNVNYVDVQGENYARNFDKITRFLNTGSASISSTSTQVTKPGIPLPRSLRFVVIAGAVAVLAAVGTLMFFNGREPASSPPPSNTSTPAQTAVQSTPSSEPDNSLATSTSAPIQPTATFADLPPTLDSMVPSAPTQPNVSGQAAFIHVEIAENMTGLWANINHPMAENPDALLFVMPNFNSPESPVGVYYRHHHAVWYRETQWAIRNQGAGGMSHATAFNVQIMNPGEHAFVHTATAQNSSEDLMWTRIDHRDASDRNALVFATQNWSPPGGRTKDNNHPIGVKYVDSQWVIFNLDGFPIQEGAAFNVQILLNPGMNAFVHKATTENTRNNWTTLDNPLAYDPRMLLFVMPRVSPDTDGVFSKQPLGVWHNGTQWAIFNQDNTVAMPVGAEFNVLILQPDEQ
ncbi:MAG TPA: hypothetical protein VK900_10865, partial [Anaerolineales bacterium]|nr:hypothetical protein [Anaerolineales bacterium]